MLSYFSLGILLTHVSSFPTYINCNLSVSTNSNNRGKNVITDVTSIMGINPNNNMDINLSLSSVCTGELIEVYFTNLGQALIHATHGTLSSGSIYATPPEAGCPYNATMKVISHQSLNSLTWKAPHFPIHVIFSGVTASGFHKTLIRKTNIIVTVQSCGGCKSDVDCNNHGTCMTAVLDDTGILHRNCSCFNGYRGYICQDGCTNVADCSYSGNCSAASLNINNGNLERNCTCLASVSGSHCQVGRCNLLTDTRQMCVSELTFCEVLAKTNLRKYGQSCNGYCNHHGLQCFGAYDAEQDDCQIYGQQRECNYIKNSGDLICNCSTEKDECLLNLDNCHPNAVCSKVPGSFECTCNSGFFGDGVSCTDSVDCPEWVIEDRNTRERFTCENISSNTLIDACTSKVSDFYGWSTKESKFYDRHTKIIDICPRTFQTVCPDSNGKAGVCQAPTRAPTQAPTRVPNIEKASSISDSIVVSIIVTILIVIFCCCIVYFLQLHKQKKIHLKERGY